jgi:hypothetical protein
LGLLEAVLQTGPSFPRRGIGFGGSFIFGAIIAVSVLLITIGVFYVLIKLGSLLDALKEKTQASSEKK